MSAAPINLHRGLLLDIQVLLREVLLISESAAGEHAENLVRISGEVADLRDVIYSGRATLDDHLRYKNIFEDEKKIRECLGIYHSADQLIYQLFVLLEAVGKTKVLTADELIDMIAGELLEHPAALPATGTAKSAALRKIYAGLHELLVPRS